MTKYRSLILVPILFLYASAFAGLNVGDDVVPFTANDDSGDLWALADHLGEKNVIVYFYPAAMTGGCTKQACAYRDDSAKLNDVDAVVIGVSGDSVNALKLFKGAHALNFPLVSDPDASIAKLFGVPQLGGAGSLEQEINGEMHTLKRGTTTSRWTFVIGKDGKVVYKNDSVEAAEDSSVVIAELQNLAK